MQRVSRRRADDAENDRAAYVTAARDVLQQHAPELLQPSPTDWVSVVATLAQYLAAQGRPLPGAMLRDLGIGIIAAELLRDWVHADQVSASVGAVFKDFVEAIRPRLIWRIAHKPADYVARLRVFAQRRAIPDADFRAHVLRLFRARTDADEARFLARIPLDRLRTYPDAVIEHVIIPNFVEWDPVLQFLARKGDDAEETLASMMRITVRALHSRGVRYDRAEDAVHGAILFIIDTLDDPWDGYHYETPLHAWFAATATNLARGHARDVEVPVPEDLPARDAARDAGELRTWKERCQFVLATVDTDDTGTKYRRACVIIDALISAAEVEDRELAQQIERETGEKCTANAIALTRMNLRARLGVFGYLDSHSEKEMIDWVRARWGVREHDQPMLRKIEASARAAALDWTLAWALMAWSLFESDRFRARWEPIARRMMPPRVFPDYEARYGGWLAGPRAHDARSIRNWATTHGYGWAIPASWHLRILRLQTPDEVAVTLGSAEAALVAAEF